VNFQIGQFVGDYEIIGKLGRGGMGAVYKVRNLISQRIDAMKVLLPDLEATPELAERFLREIRVHAGLRHPHIAQLLTAVRVENRLLMIMELVEGTGLDEILKLGAMETGDAVACVSEVLDALGYAHDQGVVHRDVKPANIVVLPEGNVKLLDFGIAQGESERRLTQTGMVVGSLSYMSPEQVTAMPVDGRSDLYSVGITLYQALTGEVPFRGGSDYDVMRAQISESPRPPSELKPDLPPPLSDAVLRALGKQPQDRFQTAEEFRIAIAPFARQDARGLSILARKIALQSSAGQADERGSAQQPIPSSSHVDSLSLEAIARNLAPFVGPIARRLVMTASRRAASLDELCRSLAEEIASPKDKTAFLRACAAHVTAPVQATPAPASQPASAVAWDAATIQRIRTELASYIGPVARLLVDRAMKQARSTEQLYKILSSEIASDSDRQKFLASGR
jgi:serine/threonine protein kinase